MDQETESKLADIVASMVAKDCTYWDGGGGSCTVCGASFVSGKVAHYPSCAVLAAKRWLDREEGDKNIISRIRAIPERLAELNDVGDGDAQAIYLDACSLLYGLADDVEDGV